MQVSDSTLTFIWHLTSIVFAAVSALHWTRGEIGKATLAILWAIWFMQGLPLLVK